MRILVVCDAFAPAFRGGSIRGVSNAVERTGDRCAFWVLTRNFDPGHAEPLDVATDRWVERGPARVWYSSRRLSPRRVSAVIDEVQPDVLLVNSLFARSVMAACLARRLWHRHLPCALGPEGELGAGALALKPRRKQAYITLARALGLLDDVWWFARSVQEVADIHRTMGEALRVRLVPNLPPLDVTLGREPIDKQPGTVRLLYLSRVTPKKNLTFLLNVLARVRGAVHLDIVGPAEPDYLDTCMAAARRLPPTVTVDVHGACTPAEVSRWLAGAHALVLPTLDENFGFAIAEALESGRPVVVSDRTPWRDLAGAEAGWDLPLVDAEWCRVIASLCDMDGDTYTRWSAGARHHWEQLPLPSEAEDVLLGVFREMCATR